MSGEPEAERTLERFKVAAAFFRGIHVFSVVLVVLRRAGDGGAETLSTTLSDESKPIHDYNSIQVLYS